MVQHQRRLVRRGESFELRREFPDGAVGRTEHRQASVDGVLKRLVGSGGFQHVGESFASLLFENRGEDEIARARGGSLCFRRGQDLADVKDGDVVSLLEDGFDVASRELTVVVLDTESNFPAFDVGDVDVAGSSRGGSGGLEHGRGGGGAVCDLVELLGSEVIDEDVEGENVADGVE